MGNNPFNVINPANPMNNNRVAQMRDMYNMFSQSKNPSMLFKNMAMRNPQMQQVLMMLNKGMRPEDLLNQICQQQNINPQELMNIIKGNNT